MQQQLAAQDSVFLSVETADVSTHIGGLAFLAAADGGENDYDQFVEFMRARLRECERLSWRLQEVPFGLDRPYWIRHRNFDVAEQIFRVALPAPGGPEELSKLVGLLFEGALDRQRPLWEMILIEGLPNGQRALLWKMHHSLMDGASGANLIEQIFDLAPDADPRRPNTQRVREKSGGGRPVHAFRVFERACWNAGKTTASRARFIGQAAKRLYERRGDAGAAIRALPTPHASFNGRVGKRRGLVWSSIPLEDVQRIKVALSVTVNDVVLAMTSGAVRAYLQQRDALPVKSLRASVPSSKRSSGDRAMGNQVRDLTVTWATDIEDPVERLLAIHRDVLRVKADVAKHDPLSVMDVLAEGLLPGTLQLLTRGVEASSGRIPMPVNAVVSNVPMSPVPLYCAGARVSKLVPFSLLMPTQGLNMTVLSYCGELHFGLAHDPDLLPDAWALAELIPKSFQELQHAVDRLEVVGL